MTDNDSDIPDVFDAPSLSVFLTGGAGTGKSTLIRRWLATRAPRNTLVAAPTGIAALNVDGVTLHRFMHVKPGVTPDEAGEQGLRLAKRDPLYRMLDALVVDEVSMVRADLMDCLDRFLQGARRDDAPFGGLRLILVGDLNQLPPVVTRNERAAFAGDPWPGPWFFQSQAIRRLLALRRLAVHELTVVHRQEDARFAALLNRVRMGETDGGVLGPVNARAGLTPPADAVSLTATNRLADLVNSSRLAALDGTEWVESAVASGRWDAALEPAPRLLHVREGMRVLMLANDKDGQWANGSTGVLLSYDPVRHVAAVRFDDGRVADVGRHAWEVAAPRVTRDGDGRVRLETVTIGSYQQMPFQAGWALTIHKAQGKTLDPVTLRLGDRPLFAAGQAYVALSRARSLDGLYLDRPLVARDVIRDPAPDVFMRLARAAAPAVQGALF